METELTPTPVHEKYLLTGAAWFSMLLISDLPDIACNALSGQVPGWLLWAKLGAMGLFFLLCAAWQRLRPLKPYAFVMLALFVGLSASELVRGTAWWQGLVDPSDSSFTLFYLRPFVRDFGVALIVLAALWILKRRRSEFYLVKGQTNAPIEPVRWLGIGQGESWRTFGWIFTIIASIAVAIPTVVALRPSGEILLQAARWLPAALGFAAINAFNEEIYFRTTLLSTLPNVIGRRQAMLINVVLFGLAHYLYGSPPGVIGFLMTGFLAFLMGKSMLETKGMLWAWMIHFLPDVVVFFSYAILWVQAGH